MQLAQRGAPTPLLAGAQPPPPRRRPPERDLRPRSLSVYLLHACRSMSVRALDAGLRRATPAATDPLGAVPRLQEHVVHPSTRSSDHRRPQPCHAAAVGYRKGDAGQIHDRRRYCMDPHQVTAV
ncbi:hypothetical protein BS78_08G097500 [Paspalum vaginatum]|nr:hypothetical protein BS78_08G097500 [Paspalum vaginatum]